ncbi:hypothetical protein J6590_012861 [Homalodisca vitripennis]|nr:hypothetical protein J6590_012861 [Homalodisca vitripennis]
MFFTLWESFSATNGELLSRRRSGPAWHKSERASIGCICASPVRCYGVNMRESIIVLSIKKYNIHCVTNCYHIGLRILFCLYRFESIPLRSNSYRPALAHPTVTSSDPFIHTRASSRTFAHQALPAVITLRPSTNNSLKEITLIGPPRNGGRPREITLVAPSNKYHLRVFEPRPCVEPLSYPLHSGAPLPDSALLLNSKKIPRPPNAFMIFANEWRKQLAQQHPTDSNKSINKPLAKKPAQNQISEQPSAGGTPPLVMGSGTSISSSLFYQLCGSCLARAILFTPCVVAIDTLWNGIFTVAGRGGGRDKKRMDLALALLSHLPVLTDGKNPDVHIPLKNCIGSYTQMVPSPRRLTAETGQKSLLKLCAHS